MSKTILLLASNYGLWAEELEAPWTALKKAGFKTVLATYKGKTPLPLQVSVDPNFIDPLQNYPVNPQDVVDRVNDILDRGEWDLPLKISDVKMSDYDGIVIVGGPGAPLDITGNMNVHKLLLEAYRNGKPIGAICYAVAALALTRNPDNHDKSIISSKKVTAHPHAWDFNFDMPYHLIRTNDDNHGTDLITPGFVFPLQYMVEDAVGMNGTVIADEKANRTNPCVVWDKPFLTALSVESAIAFGEKLVSVLKDEYKY